MAITQFATFESDFPDDSVEENGDIVVPGGQNILLAIHGRLAAQGYALSNVEQHSHYGWSFNLRGKEGRFWLLLQYPDPWLLQVLELGLGPIWTHVFGDPTGLKAMIEKCRECLESIPEVRSITWMSRKEYETSFRH